MSEEHEASKLSITIKDSQRSPHNNTNQNRGSVPFKHLSETINEEDENLLQPLTNRTKSDELPRIDQSLTSNNEISMLT